jgi:hypothetical protein
MGGNLSENISLQRLRWPPEAFTLGLRPNLLKRLASSESIKSFSHSLWKPVVPRKKLKFLLM